MLRFIGNLLLESVPMIAFYIASFYLGFLESTAIYVALTLLVIAIIKHTADRLPYLSLIFGVFVVGSGALTLLLHEPQILIFADTLYFFMGAAVLSYSLTTHRTLVERLFGYAFDLTHHGWRILTWQWVAVFLFAGISNEIVRLTMSPEWWIGFQFWRAIAINVFILVQIPYCHRHRVPETTNWFGVRLSYKQ
jgi:intracellular septation protein